jgi:hypothetical protein
VTPDLVPARLRNQGLVASSWRSPRAVVAALGAVQSQDYGGAKWAIGMRVPGLSDSDVDRAFDRGDILRTHVMRPTWHFVAPRDIRWLLALTAPRIHAMNGLSYRRSGLDAPALKRSRRVIEKALADGTFLTRDELAGRLDAAGLKLRGNPLAHVMMHAELEGVVCSGPRHGRQFTYALLDERAPASRALNRDEALATLVLRYFTSHGPATTRDFAWWSGLTAADAVRGLEINARALTCFTREGRTYWHDGARLPGPGRNPAIFLLPNYDECLIAYKDRLPMPPELTTLTAGVSLGFAHHLVADGFIIGAWRRDLTARRARIGVKCFKPLSSGWKRRVADEVERMSRFLGVPVDLDWH